MKKKPKTPRPLFMGKYKCRCWTDVMARARYLGRMETARGQDIYGPEWVFWYAARAVEEEEKAEYKKLCQEQW